MKVMFILLYWNRYLAFTTSQRINLLDMLHIILYNTRAVKQQEKNFYTQV